MSSRQAMGAGLGFRRELIPAMQAGVPDAIQFFELAPENWAQMGGASARQLRAFTERYPFVCHGLSLSLGGIAPLDTQLLSTIRQFMHLHGIERYTEHLSWCSDTHHLYDLLPLPRTEEAVHWVAGRIRQAQDVLGMRIAVENASAYLDLPGAELDEASFIRAVLAEADCDLHLDVNNLYVNSCNFNFDAAAALRALPLERVTYLHVAGHHREPDGLLVDTHGAAVIDPVWALLADAYQLIGHAPPTCLERDFDFPDLAALTVEITQIAACQAAAPGAEGMQP